MSLIAQPPNASASEPTKVAFQTTWQSQPRLLFTQPNQLQHKDMKYPLRYDVKAGDPHVFS
jgi:hypothetical protein